MEKVRTTKKKLKYLGKECLVTTLNYTNTDEGKRLIIREFADGHIDLKLVEGYANRYAKKIPFKTGDILIFPSTFLYPHVVKEVTEGTRYSFVAWAY